MTDTERQKTKRGDIILSFGVWAFIGLAIGVFKGLTDINVPFWLSGFLPLIMAVIFYNKLIEKHQKHK